MPKWWPSLVCRFLAGRSKRVRKADKKNNGMKSDEGNQCRTKGSVRPIKFCSREPDGNFFRGELDVSVSFSKRISEPQREKIGNFKGDSHVYPKRI